MTLVENVTKTLDTGKIVVAVSVYLDIRKAFDSISTNILLDKLYKIYLYRLPVWRDKDKALGYRPGGHGFKSCHGHFCCALLAN